MEGQTPVGVYIIEHLLLAIKENEVLNVLLLIIKLVIMMYLLNLFVILWF